MILFIILMGLIGYINDEVCWCSKEIVICKINGVEVRFIFFLLFKDIFWVVIFLVVIGIYGVYYMSLLWIS